MHYLSRGDCWFTTLTKNMVNRETLIPSIKVADGQFAGQLTRFISVVPDAHNHYPRTQNGEVGLLEGWGLALLIQETIKADANNETKRPIIAIIDVPSQAYGRREEALAIHQALAASVNAYAMARITGHPVIGLIVGKAMSGAFLAHGYQANQLIAFNDHNVMVHAMGKESAARITLRSVNELEKLASSIPPMAYDIENYQTLGLLNDLITLTDPDNPTESDLKTVNAALEQAIDRAKNSKGDLSHRLHGKNRTSSLLVRQRMREVW